ncbi:RmlD-like substrate binding domain-containing protein [Geopyxis carbonaria]|nr:RmlD-like substrate binding domain-containing protein [Geopyxis carbonaria]
MSDKTVLITGATGLLGRQCLNAFEEAGWNAIGTGFSRAKPPKIHKLDLGDSEAVTTLIDETKPKVVLHCAAERAPDKCENDREGTKALNVLATRSLASTCQSRGIILIYISTDYVFPGRPGEAPYSADAQTAPPNFYGETKLGGEQAVLEFGGVVMRVPVLYGEVEKNGESAVNTLMDAVYKAGKEKVEMDAWSIRYPTNTEDVARVLKDVAEKYTSEGSEKLPRVLQFSAEERMTKYEICQTMAEIMGLPLTHMVPNDTNDPNAAVQRPYDCHLSTQVLKDIGISVDTIPFKGWWQREVRAYKK